MFSRSWVVPLLSYLFLHYLCPQASTSAVLETVCDINANCTNTDDSYICACKEGYAGDGNSCQGIIIAFDLVNNRINFPTNNKKLKFDVFLSVK